MGTNELRVLMFSDSYGDVTTTFIRNESAYFARHHHLRYLTLATAGPDVPEFVEVVPRHRRPIRDRIEWRLWRLDLRCSFHDARFAERLSAAIGRFRPDVIHCQFAYEGLRLLQNIDISSSPPVLVHFHGYDASEMIRKRSYVRALVPLLRMTHVQPVVVSEYMKSELQRAGLDMSRAAVLRCGIDLELFRPAAALQPIRDGKEIVITQISSLIAKKGHRETLRAIALLLGRRPDLKARLRYRIAGGGPDRQSIQDLATSLGLATNVEFLGAVAPAQAVELLADSDAFAHHSVTQPNGDKEGIPTAIMEAMAMELPVLSTRHAGIPELVEHGVHGLLCEERDVETYSRHIEEVITWGHRPGNRERIQSEYNMHSHNASLERIYRRAIAER